MPKRSRHVNLARLRKGGRIFEYRDLPLEAQVAIHHYMAADGCFWNTDSTEASVELYGNMKFGFVMVPMHVLQEEVMKSEFMHEDFPGITGFDEYHQWFMHCGGMEGRGGRGVWPVILSSTTDEALQDGWHRFHQYVERGLDVVPAVYYVRKQRRTT